MSLNKLSLLRRLSIVTALSFVSACGGGSSDSGMLLEGTLIQGETAGHVESARLRHGAGETIAEVTVCALGDCSVTDSNGQWGFIADENFTGGDVAFVLNGHGIVNGTAVASIPNGASSVAITFERKEGSTIVISHLDVDGKTIIGSHSDEDSHDEEAHG